MKNDIVKEMEDFFKNHSENIIENLQQQKTKSFMVYCDYIAHLITDNLKTADDQDMAMLTEIGKMKYDLSEEGWFVSSKKTIEVTDINGQKYKISVEAV